MRRVLPLTIILLLITGHAAVANKSPEINPVPGGVVVTGQDDTNTPGGGIKKTPPPAETCPGYQSELTAPPQGPQIGPGGGYYVWQRWRCPPADWKSRSVCIYLCPPGVATIAAPPPPTDEQIRARLDGYVIKPIGRFAPPVGQPAVKAIVGMRFYYSVDPSTYAVIALPTQQFPGGWQVTATLTPGRITFVAGDVTSTCDGPGTSGRTKTGRTKADREGCYVIFETVPNTGRADATITTEWTITVTAANFTDAIGRTWNEQASNPYDIGLRELQAVGQAN